MFTLTHLGIGVWLGHALPVWQVALLGAVFEVVEGIAKDRYPQWFPYSSQDSKGNSVMDVAAITAGAMIAKWSMSKNYTPTMWKKGA